MKRTDRQKIALLKQQRAAKFHAILELRRQNAELDHARATTDAKIAQEQYEMLDLDLQISAVIREDINYEVEKLQ